MKVAETMVKILKNLVLKKNMINYDIRWLFSFLFTLFSSVCSEAVFYFFVFYELMCFKKACSLYIFTNISTVQMEFRFCRQMRFFYDGEVICEIATLQKFRHLVDLRLNGGDFNK